MNHALNCLSCLFVSEDSQIVEWALNENLFAHLCKLFERKHDNNLIHLALFCLSNVTASKLAAHSRRFLDNEILVEHVLIQIRNPKFVVSVEATWVLTNAIGQVEIEDLKNAVRVYKTELVHLPCHWLERQGARGDESRLIF